MPQSSQSGDFLNPQITLFWTVPTDKSYWHLFILLYPEYSSKIYGCIVQNVYHRILEEPTLFAALVNKREAQVSLDLFVDFFVRVLAIYLDSRFKTRILVLNSLTPISLTSVFVDSSINSGLQQSENSTRTTRPKDFF